MNRLDRYKKNISSIKERFNNNISIVTNEYTPRKKHTMFYCKKHNHTFQSSIHDLLKMNVTCGCPLCKSEAHIRNINNNIWNKLKATIEQEYEDLIQQ